MSTTPAAPDAAATQHMQCMEVWGGNAVVDRGVVMAGLDAWVFSRPYRGRDESGAAGGDVYYVSSCATGRITRLLIADVSGHGAAACDVAGQLRGMMRRYVNHLDQRQFVRAMNDRFIALANSGCFATAVITTFFAPTNYLTLCNAGHPPPLVYRAARRTWGFLEPRARAADADDDAVTNAPLGIVDACAYEQFGVRLAVGDLVLCYTDSAIECRRRDDPDEELGAGGLLDVVRGVDVGDPATLIRRVVAAIEAGCDTAGDDLTLLLFRPNGLAPTPTLGTRLMAPVRVLRGALARRDGARAKLPDLSVANVGGALADRLNRRWGG